MAEKHFSTIKTVDTIVHRYKSTLKFAAITGLRFAIASTHSAHTTSSKNPAAKAMQEMYIASFQKGANKGALLSAETW